MTYEMNIKSITPALVRYQRQETYQIPITYLNMGLRIYACNDNTVVLEIIGMDRSVIVLGHTVCAEPPAVTECESVCLQDLCR